MFEALEEINVISKCGWFSLDSDWGGGGVFEVGKLEVGDVGVIGQAE